MARNLVMQLLLTYMTAASGLFGLAKLLMPRLPSVHLYCVLSQGWFTSGILDKNIAMIQIFFYCSYVLSVIFSDLITTYRIMINHEDGCVVTKQLKN